MARTKTWGRTVGGKVLNNGTKWAFDTGSTWELCNVVSPATTGDTMLRTIFDVEMSFALPNLPSTADEYTDVHTMRAIAYSVTTFEGDLTVPSPTDSFDELDLLTGTTYLYGQPYGTMADYNRQQISFRPPGVIDTRAMRTSKVAGKALDTRLYLNLGLPPFMWSEGTLVQSPLVSITSYLRVLYETGTA